MQIEKYSFGQIILDGKQYHGDLVLTDQRVRKWPCADHHHPALLDFPEITRDPYEILIIGTGYADVMEVNAALQNQLETLVNQVIIAPTPQACNAHNRLTQENKKIITYLHLTC